MLEKILENVINAMVPCLDSGQLEKLNNVLYIEFHGGWKWWNSVLSWQPPERMGTRQKSGCFWPQRRL